MSSSSEEDQSSVVRHRSSKPSETQPSGALSDQNQPQHDPDPPLLTWKWLCLTFPPNTLKRWTLLGAFFPSLISGSLCLGPELQLWVWMMKKAIKSSDLEVLLLCYHSAQLSKMLLISLNMISRLLIYLRANTSNFLLSLQSVTRWDSPVTRRNFRS